MFAVTPARDCAQEVRAIEEAHCRPRRQWQIADHDIRARVEAATRTLKAVGAAGKALLSADMPAGAELDDLGTDAPTGPMFGAP